MSDLVKILNFTAHPQLEKSLGYQQNHRWVAFHWEPEINQVMYSDGNNFGAGINLAWQIFLQHPVVSAEVEEYTLNETDKYWLILDRQTRNLYVGSEKIVPTMFEQPESLTLLACLNDKSYDVSAVGENLNSSYKQFSIGELFQNLIKYLIPVGIASGLIAAVAAGGWLLVGPKFKQVNQDGTSKVVVGGFACGIGGSNDFSAFFNTPRGNKELHLVGVYEARSDHRGGYHPTGTIDIKIERQERPIILALSSYEPVQWNLVLEPEVNLEKVIINGYHDQKISGISGIPIQEFSYQQTGKYLGKFAYRWDKLSPNSDTLSLVNKLEQFTNTNLTSFQGCYRGTSFTIK